MRTFVVLAALAAVLVLAAPAGAAPRPFHANLSGAGEVPDPGDDNGTGTAALRLDRAAGRVCFTIRARSIDNVVAAHIHEGRRGVAGSIVVDLITEPVQGRRFTGCNEDVSGSLIRRISRNPRGYYVNVHTEAFPGGAIRGQLRKGRLPS
jgi:CHRD domain